jgi:hypothetical protein
MTSQSTHAVIFHSFLLCLFTDVIPNSFDDSSGTEISNKSSPCVWWIVDTCFCILLRYYKTFSLTDMFALHMLLCLPWSIVEPKFLLCAGYVRIKYMVNFHLQAYQFRSISGSTFTNHPVIWIYIVSILTLSMKNQLRELLLCNHQT